MCFLAIYFIQKAAFLQILEQKDNCLNIALFNLLWMLERKFKM